MIFLEGAVVDAGGTPLAGIKLSNGELIVVTDVAGTYEIEAQPGRHRFLTLSVPRGYERPDRWFLHIDADAVPGTRLRFDVTLHSVQRDPLSFTVAHVTDLHMNGEAEGGVDPETGICFTDPQILAADLAAIEADCGPDFILATGDLTNTGTITQFEALGGVLDTLSTPFYPGFGLHDANVLSHRTPGLRVEAGSQIRDWLDESNAGITVSGNYERMVGPTHYSFDRGSWHIIAFPNESHGFSIYDQLRMERWLEYDLSLLPEGTPVLFATHMPPRLDLLEWLEVRGVKLLLHGHTHSARVYHHRDLVVAATPPVCWGGSDTNPRGFRRICLHGDQFEMEFRPLRNVLRRPRQSEILPSSNASVVIWETHLPAHVHRAAPVVFEDDLIISLQDDDGGGLSGICRIHGMDGGTVWHTKTDSAVRNSVAVSADGGILAVTHCGRLLRLDADSGRIEWSRDLWGFPHRWLATTPLVDGETVFVGAKSGYGAYESDSGATCWETRFSGTLDLTADPAGDKWGAYLTPTLTDDHLITHVPRRSLMAMARSDGRIAWELSTPTTEDYWASPIPVDNMLIAGAEPGHVIALDSETGRLIWDVPALVCDGHRGQYVTGFAIDGDRVFGGTENGWVFAMNPKRGEVVWWHQTEEALLHMSPARRGGGTLLARPVPCGAWLLVSGVDGYLRFLDTESGSCDSKLELGSPVSAAPAVVEGGLVVATWEGRLRRIALPASVQPST